MALNFQPPEWLIREYMARKQPAEIANESIGTAISGYAAAKQQQQQAALAQQAKDVEMAKGISAGGQDFTNSLAQIQAQRQAPTTPTAQGPSVMDRFKAFLGSAPVGKSPLVPEAGQPTDNFQPPVPSTGTLPSIPSTPSPMTKGPTSDPLVQEYMADPIAFKKQHGTQGLDKLKTQIDIDKGLHDKSNGPLEALTKKQALANGTFDPSKQYLIDPSREDQGESRQERLGSSLRKELTSSEPYKRLTTSKAAADNIAQAVKDPGAYGDLATLFDYMKSLDPTSVVREGEQETFRKTGSFTQSMANSMNKLVSGQNISPEQRQEILKYTQSRLKTAHNIYKNHSDPTLRQAKRIGADPLEVDPFYDQTFERLIGSDEAPKPKSALMHLSTKELQDLRKKLTVHQSNGN